MVASKNTYQPFLNEGFGLRSLVRLNEASNLKLGVGIMNSSESRAILLRDRIFKSYGTIKYHIFSALWTGIKSEFLELCSNTSWSIGSSHRIKF